MASSAAPSSIDRGERAVKLALDEARILALGAQAVLGVSLSAVFEDRFQALAPGARAIHSAGVVATAVALAVALWPTAWHRIALGHGHEAELQAFTSRVMGWALAPLALGTAAPVFLAATAIAGGAAATIVGAAALLFAASMWFGIERADARALAEARPMKPTQGPPADLAHSIDHLLTETRVVLPGSQALLAFQSAAVLMNGFASLPRAVRFAHLASTLLVAIATVMLIAPAAYHRIVERGGFSERFLAFGARMILAAMAVLGLGICADLGVVVARVTGSERLAVALAGALLAFVYGLWFAAPAAIRARRRRRTISSRTQAHTPTREA